MPFILGKKLKMTQIWKNDKVIPVTPVLAGPVKITQVKTKEKDGYEAVQVGFDEVKKKLKKPQAGHLRNLGSLHHLKEFKIEAGIKNKELGFNRGDILNINQFSEGQKVKVTGISKAKGFQGVVKRYGFRGGPKTHGQKNRLRAPGSIGATAPQRVMPGLRMAGRMGGEQVTLKNLEIAGIDKGGNILFLKGAVPGKPGTLLKISVV